LIRPNGLQPNGNPDYTANVPYYKKYIFTNVPYYKKYIFTNVLQTCRANYHEALPILYGKNLLAFHDNKVSKPIPSTGRGFVLLGTEHHFLSPKNKPARARQHGDKVLNFRDYIYQLEPEAPYTEVSKKLVRCALTCTVYSPSHMRAICQAKRIPFLPVEGILPFPKEHLTMVRYLTVDIYPLIYGSTRKMAAFLMLLSKPDIRLKDFVDLDPYVLYDGQRYARA